MRGRASSRARSPPPRSPSPRPRKRRRRAALPSLAALPSRLPPALPLLPPPPAPHDPALAARACKYRARDVRCAAPLPPIVAETTACTICLGGLPRADKDLALLLPCAHAFHYACIAPWLARDPAVLAPCPLCRTRPDALAYDIEDDRSAGDAAGSDGGGGVRMHVHRPLREEAAAAEARRAPAHARRDARPRTNRERVLRQFARAARAAFSAASPMARVDQAARTEATRVASAAQAAETGALRSDAFVGAGVASTVGDAVFGSSREAELQSRAVTAMASVLPQTDVLVEVPTSGFSVAAAGSAGAGGVEYVSTVDPDAPAVEATAVAAAVLAQTHLHDREAEGDSLGSGSLHREQRRRSRDDALGNEQECAAELQLSAAVKRVRR